MSLATTAFAIQRQLFPMLEEEIGPLSDPEQRFVRVVERSHPERFMAPFQGAFLGRKPEDRLPLAQAFGSEAQARREIQAFSRQLGHVPIIDPHPRGAEKIPMDPATARRFKQRSASERVNSQLKDNSRLAEAYGVARVGALFVRVRGAVPLCGIMCHLMFGVWPVPRSRSCRVCRGDTPFPLKIPPKPARPAWRRDAVS